MGDLLGVQLGAQQRKEGGELRKDEHAMSVVDGLGEQFVEAVELR